MFFLHMIFYCLFMPQIILKHYIAYRPYRMAGLEPPQCCPHGIETTIEIGMLETWIIAKCIICIDQKVLQVKKGRTREKVHTVKHIPSIPTQFSFFLFLTK